MNSSDPLAPDRPRLGLEVLVVLAISLGQSGVYSVLRIIERMTRGVQLNQQTSTLNLAAIDAALEGDGTDPQEAAATSAACRRCSRSTCSA